jgi:protease I
MAAFVRALLSLCAGEPATPAPLLRMHSDPPQENPLEQPNQSLRWLAAPSFGTMLSLALLGVGVVAAQRVRHRQATDPPEASGAAAPTPDASARAPD